MISHEALTEKYLTAQVEKNKLIENNTFAFIEFVEKELTTAVEAAEKGIIISCSDKRFTTFKKSHARLREINIDIKLLVKHFEEAGLHVRITDGGSKYTTSKSQRDTYCFRNFENPIGNAIIICISLSTQGEE